jgi:hypothetical protein
MSFQAQTWVINHSKHKGSALLVMLMIANHAHADGTNAFPSVSTLARECRMSDRQITRIIQQLETSGELVVDRSAGRFTHRYAIAMTEPTRESKSPEINPDNMTGLSDSDPDNLSPLTLTFPIPNPDICDANPDIAVSPKLTRTEKEELKLEPHSHRAPRATPAPQSANAGVSVCSPESRFSLEERKAHAAANGLKGGWLTNSRDGRYDEMIADQLARRTPEAVEQALATPTLKFKSHSEALMHVASVVSRGGVGSEPVPEIERLFESGQIDEETCARLLARAWSAAPPRPRRETTPEHSTVTRLRPVTALGAA